MKLKWKEMWLRTLRRQFLQIVKRLFILLLIGDQASSVATLNRVARWAKFEGSTSGPFVGQNAGKTVWLILQLKAGHFVLFKISLSNSKNHNKVNIALICNLEAAVLIHSTPSCHWHEWKVRFLQEKNKKRQLHLLYVSDRVCEIQQKYVSVSVII